MDMTTIGRQIAALRREKGAKQEELANHVGVTAQAVSKWENGGVPDTELLPAIADFFGVSIDALFGRSMTDYGDLQAAIARKIAETPQEDQFAQIMEFCWDMERALFGRSEVQGTLADQKKKIKERQHYSQVLYDTGFTLMGLGKKREYFLVVPDAEDSEAAYFDGIDYAAFFRDFGEKEVFDACVMLHRRKENKAFTPSLLVKHLGLTTERAREVIEILKKRKLVYETAIELDDETQIVYTFNPAPAFVALLIFAQEMIERPNCFTYSNHSRHNPYL